MVVDGDGGGGNQNRKKKHGNDNVMVIVILVVVIVTIKELDSELGEEYTNESNNKVRIPIIIVTKNSNEK